MSAVPMLDSGRGTASPDELESLDGCPLCEAPRDRFTVLTTRGDRFAGERAVLCGRCGLVFLDPRLTPQALDRYYRSDTFSQEVRGGERPSREAIAYRDMRARRRWRFLQAALPRHGRCIEIGCGAGNFLEILSDAGYDVVGVDPSTGYAAYARERGLEVTAGRFPDDLSGGGPFDLAFMFHVLEHVPAPLEILRQIREQLDPGGLLLLEYPDVELAARRRFLPSTYFERAHLFDFSARDADRVPDAGRLQGPPSVSRGATPAVRPQRTGRVRTDDAPVLRELGSGCGGAVGARASAKAAAFAASDAAATTLEACEKAVPWVKKPLPSSMWRPTASMSGMER